MFANISSSLVNELYYFPTPTCYYHPGGGAWCIPENFCSATRIGNRGTDCSQHTFFESNEKMSTQTEIISYKCQHFSHCSKWGKASEKESLLIAAPGKPERVFYDVGNMNTVVTNSFAKVGIRTKFSYTSYN